MTRRLTMTQRILATVLAATVVTGGSLAVLLVVELPNLVKQRAQIDNLRAANIIDQQRRENLQAVAKQLSDLHDQQTVLDEKIWKFTNEEKFFSMWTDLAHQTGTKIDDPTVSDATPGKGLVERSVNLTLVGPLNNVLSAITAIQQISPVVAISSVTLKPATLAGQVSAVIKASSVWN